MSEGHGAVSLGKLKGMPGSVCVQLCKTERYEGRGVFSLGKLKDLTGVVLSVSEN